MQTLCVSSNWPSVEALHPRQLDIFVHGWQDDCPPPDVNGAAPAVTAPAVPGQGVGTSRKKKPLCPSGRSQHQFEPVWTGNSIAYMRCCWCGKREPL